MSCDAPDLTEFDVILVNTSAGKDSQAMLDLVAPQAAAAGVADRLVAVHCDLGRVEWAGTAELAERQARYYGIRFEKVTRPQGDLLDHIETRGMFPSAAARYCTSDHKRGQVRKLMTALTAELRRPDGTTAHADGTVDDRPVRILNCMGLRAQESPARAKRPALAADTGASNGRRTVTTWLPILDWTLEQVWDRIHASGVEHHWAYDAGMPRLSCAFCLAGETEVVTRSGIQRIDALAGAAHSLLIPKVTKYGLSGHGHFSDVPVLHLGTQAVLCAGRLYSPDRFFQSPPELPKAASGRDYPLDVWAGPAPWPAGAPPKAERPGRLRYRNSLPLPMVDRVIRMFSPGPDSGADPWSALVADPFLGGGTTAIAALTNQRRFAGADINPDSLRFTAARITVETGCCAPA